MIRRGTWLAGATWLLSATAVWAGGLPTVEGPSLDGVPVPCGEASVHRSCGQALIEWLSYHPTHCAECGWCHNCTSVRPPLYVFFLDYGWNNAGGAGCSYGQATCPRAHPNSSPPTERAKACTSCGTEKACKP
jgi:hypothetical protein